jgi:hypothetical protein
MEIMKNLMYNQLKGKKKASEIRGFFRLCNYYLCLRIKGKTLPENINKIVDWYVKNIIH